MLATFMKKQPTPPRYTARDDRKAVRMAKVKIRCRLQDLLDERGMTRTAFSEATGLTPPAVRGLCENTAKRIDVDTLGALCSFFDTNWHELFEVLAKEEWDE
jgi:DNA-binding Xre family transcriptional regulator